jgi:A/G-specific adenine glycosylase
VPTWKTQPGIVRHGFTHFELEIEVYVAEVVKHPPLSWPGLVSSDSVRTPSMTANQMDGRLKGGHDKLRARWVSRDTLANVELPTVMRKIVEHGLDGGGPLFAVKPRPSKKFALRKP